VKLPRLVLGVESSCDDSSVAVLEHGVTLRAHLIATQDVHRLYGGVVPELASRAHLELLPRLTSEALAEAGVEPGQISGVAVTHAPGLVGSLVVGVAFAKAWAWALGVPVVGVNHIEGHLHSASVEHGEGAPPSVALIVSGGHTELVLVRAFRDYEWLGSTLDDAAGEAYDKVAKRLGLGFPGGPLIDQHAAQGRADAFDFPRPMLDRPGCDFSFSGLKTAVLYRAFGQDARPGAARRAEPLAPVADVCASFQESVVDVLVERTLAAVRKTGVREVVLGGGVAANGRLRERMTAACAAAGVRALVPPPALCTDNAAMVAASGYLRLAAGERDALDLDCHPRPVRAAYRTAASRDPQRGAGT
jgi:N6-L-threonylcarbamoyladenine synthase